MRSLARLTALLLTLAVLLIAPLALAFVPPPIHGHVTDATGKLAEDDRLAIDHKLEDYRLRNKKQIAVLVTPSLDGETIEDVAYETFRAWKLGEKGADDGVLLVIAPTERKDRIETGKGVGGDLTDLQTNDILRKRVSPHLRDGDLRAAIDDGTDGIMAALGGVVGPVKRPPRGVPSRDATPHLSIGGTVMLILFLLFVVVPILRRGGRRGGGFFFFGGGGGGDGGGFGGGGGGDGGSGFTGGGGESGGGGSSDSY